MAENLDLADLQREPRCVATEVRLRTGDDFLLRPLEAEDVELLGDYFEGLSEETITRYRPHEFDRETAEEICAELDRTRDLRMIALTLDEDEERMAAYFIVAWTAREGEMKRYAGYGIELDPRLDCTLAPSVADQWQDMGLGTLMLRHVLEVAALVGRRFMVLGGGTRAENERAIHFYAKHGFRKVGEFEAADVNNYDMILELAK